MGKRGHTIESRPANFGGNQNPEGHTNVALTRQKRMFSKAMLVEMLSQGFDESGGPKRLRKVARKVWDLAEDGTQWAVEFIRDGLEGKPADRPEGEGVSYTGVKIMIVDATDGRFAGGKSITVDSAEGTATVTRTQ